MLPENMGSIILLLFLFLIVEIIAVAFNFRWLNNQEHRYILAATKPLNQLLKKPIVNIAGISTESASPLKGGEVGTTSPLPTKAKLIKSTTSLSENDTTPENYYSPGKIIGAINKYRMQNGIPAINEDSKLTVYAGRRAVSLQSQGKLDNHSQFEEYIQKNAFKELGFTSLGENHSEGYKITEQQLIENVFAKSQTHNQIQLNPAWSHAGVGVSGTFVNIVFGGRN